MLLNEGLTKSEARTIRADKQVRPYGLMGKM